VEKIIVVGASGHAKVVVDIIEKQELYSILGLIGLNGPTPLDYPSLGLEEEFPNIAQAHQVKAGIVAIGDNWTRSKVVERIKSIMPDFKFITAIHPSAQIGRGAAIGDGTVVMAGAIINSGSVIGEHCIINTKASIDHDNTIGDFVSVAPNATTGGNVTIKPFSAIGLGANIIHGINIGEQTVIGAGALVLHDMPSFVVAYGMPATVRRQRIAGERYL